MADENQDGAAGSANGNGSMDPVGGAPDTNPKAAMLAQYIRDLSFENPQAPVSLQNLSQKQPKIEVNVNVGARKLNEEAFEVSLKISAKASYDDQAAFVVELDYGSLFGIKNVPEDQIQAFLLIQGPTLMFPFARRIVADATRDGGFPPLLLDPIDFRVLYAQQQQQSAATADAANDMPA